MCSKWNFPFVTEHLNVHCVLGKKIVLLTLWRQNDISSFEMDNSQINKSLQDME